MIKERLLAEITAYRKSKKYEDPHDYPFHFYASEAGEKCLRKIYFKRLMKWADRENDKQLLLYETGYVFHRRLQKMFPKKSMEVSVVIPFRDFQIRGRVDLVYEGKVYEFKSVSRLPHEPYPLHEAQVEVYLRGLKKKQAELIYILKKDFQMAGFPITKDANRWAEIKLRIKKVVQAIKDKNVPVGSFSYNCKYCFAYSRCRQMKFF